MNFSFSSEVSSWNRVGSVGAAARGAWTLIGTVVAQALLLVLLGDALATDRRREAAILCAASGIILGFGALTRAERQTFRCITRGFPMLRVLRKSWWLIS
jgi:hypothetical protein